MIKIFNKGLFIFCILFTLSISGNTQQNAHQIKVIDKNTKLPVPFAYITLQQKEGEVKRSDLIFSLTANEHGIAGLEFEEKQANVVGIYSLGYQSKYVPINQLKGRESIIELSSRSFVLNEVSVNSLKMDISPDISPIPVSVITGEEIELKPDVTLPDILDKDPSIALVRDGIWSTSVLLRGFPENRIVFMIDGARIETATDVAGALSMINPDEIEKVEIIKGASSSIFGSKAMGGVINVLSGTTDFTPEFRVDGYLSTEFQTVNNLFSQNVNLSLSDKNWTAEISGFNRNADDLRTPEGTIDNSSFNDQGVSTKLGFKLNERHSFRMRYQLFHGWDIGIPAGKVFPSNATVKYNVADRNLFSFDYKFSQIQGALESIEFKYYRQSINRDVEVNPNIPANNNPRQLQYINPNGLHVVNGLLVQGQSSVKNISILSGIDLWQRRLETERLRYFKLHSYDSISNTSTESDLIIGEKPLPDARSNNIGFFLHSEMDVLNEKVLLLFNSRVDFITNENDSSWNPLFTIMNGQVNNHPDNQELIYASGSNQFISWGLNLGINYKADNGLGSSLNIGRSFTAPSLEELYKFIDLGSRIEYGNPDLKPENAYTINAGLSFDHTFFQLNGDIYFNRLENLIALVRMEDIPFPHHSSYQLSRPDLIVFQNQNIQDARIYGFDLNANVFPAPSFMIFGNLGYVVGENISDDTWLPFMPPLQGRSGIKYKFRNLIEGELSVRFFSDQNRIAEGEVETEGSYYFNMYLNTRKFDMGILNLSLAGGIENIFNTTYSWHLSVNRGGLPFEPGRNVFVKAKFSW